VSAKTIRPSIIEYARAGVTDTDLAAQEEVLKKARLERFGARRGRRLVQGAQGDEGCGSHVFVFFASRLTKDCESFCRIASL
jgi:hypothetical protein